MVAPQKLYSELIKMVEAYFIRGERKDLVHVSPDFGLYGMNIYYIPNYNGERVVVLRGGDKPQNNFVWQGERRKIPKNAPYIDREPISEADSYYSKKFGSLIKGKTKEFSWSEIGPSDEFIVAEIRKIDISARTIKRILEGHQMIEKALDFTTKIADSLEELVT